MLFSPYNGRHWRQLELVAPNKLKMFCIHVQYIYLSVAILKRGPLKTFQFSLFHYSPLFVCRQSDAVSPFIYFFIYFFLYFLFPADSAAGMKAASGSGVALCFRWPLCFLFFWSMFAPLLKKFSARLQRARGRAWSKWAETAERPLKWFWIRKKIRWNLRQRWHRATVFCPLLRSLHLWFNLPTPALAPTLTSIAVSHSGKADDWPLVDFSS